MEFDEIAPDFARSNQPGQHARMAEFDEVHERLPDRVEQSGSRHHAYEPLLDTRVYHTDVEEDGELVRRFGYEAAWPTAFEPGDLLAYLAGDIAAYYEDVDVGAGFVEHELETLDGFVVFPGEQGDPTLNYPALLDGTVDEVKTAVEQHPVDYGALYVAEALGADRVTLKEWIQTRERETDSFSVEGDLGRIMDRDRFPAGVGLLRINLGPSDTLTWVRKDGYNELRIDVSAAEDLNVAEDGVVGADVEMPDTTTFMETYRDTLPEELAEQVAAGDDRFQEGDAAAMHAASHTIAKVREDYNTYTEELEERRPNVEQSLWDYLRLAFRRYT